MSSATVITDASFGPAQEGRGGGVGGWAAWVRVDHLDHPIKRCGVLKDPSLQGSAEAEVYAALNGIWLAAQRGATSILVRSDCMTVTQLIEGTAKSPSLRELWNDALRRDDMRGLSLQALHVKGHGPIKTAASYANDWCDKASRAQMKQARTKAYGK